jgi:hypothetical protein
MLSHIAQRKIQCSQRGRVSQMLPEIEMIACSAQVAASSETMLFILTVQYLQSESSFLQFTTNSNNI